MRYKSSIRAGRAAQRVRAGGGLHATARSDPLRCHKQKAQQRCRDGADGAEEPHISVTLNAPGCKRTSARTLRPRRGRAGRGGDPSINLEAVKRVLSGQGASGDGRAAEGSASEYASGAVEAAHALVRPAAVVGSECIHAADTTGRSLNRTNVPGWRQSCGGGGSRHRAARSPGDGR